MDTMLSKFKEQLCSTSRVMAAPVPAQSNWSIVKKLDELSNQVKQIQKQQQEMQDSYAMAAYDQPKGKSHPFQPRNWQGQQNTKVDQWQWQVTCLEIDLWQYQNLHQPEFHSFGRSYRSTGGDPVCTYCNRVGHTWRVCWQHTRGPWLPPIHNQPSASRQPTNRPPTS